MPVTIDSWQPAPRQLRPPPGSDRGGGYEPDNRRAGVCQVIAHFHSLGICSCRCQMGRPACFEMAGIIRRRQVKLMALTRPELLAGTRGELQPRHQITRLSDIPIQVSSLQQGALDQGKRVPSLSETSPYPNPGMTVRALWPCLKARLFWAHKTVGGTLFYRSALVFKLALKFSSKLAGDIQTIPRSGGSVPKTVCFWDR